MNKIRTSAELIEEAQARGETVVQLADGDVWVAPTMLPDIVCNHPECDQVYDHRQEKWRGNGAVGSVKKRDEWHFGRCPKHSDQVG